MLTSKTAQKTGDAGVPVLRARQKLIVDRVWARGSSAKAVWILLSDQKSFLRGGQRSWKRIR